jgi:glycosyltransferase involved in cell wall biosynthesis
MPRLLFITYAYPPLPAAGSIRAGGLAKYLPGFGWDVLVLTAKLPAGLRPAVPVVETEYQSVIGEWKARFGMDPKQGLHERLKLSQSSQPNSNRFHTNLIDLARALIAFPDEQRGWIRFAVNALSDLKANEHPDIILSTSPPVSGHLIAARAQRLFNRPWVADLRDLWAATLSGPQRLLRPRHQLLERRTLRTANALVTVSTPWAHSLQRKFPSTPVYSITNGFDPDDFPAGPKSLTEYLSLTHTGYLYEGKRDPTLLFEVLRDLIAEGAVHKNDIRVRFYGPPEFWLSALVERYRLKEVVEIAGRVPREEALRRQGESHLLLLLGWSDPRETGQHTGKLFEYFGSARPILAVGGAEGVLTETLNETGTGVHIRDKARLRQHLLSCYAEFKSKGFVAYHLNQEAVQQYTHLEMARKFSAALTAVLKDSNTERSGHKRRPLQTGV